MDYEEEQSNEIIVLQSIYFEEMTIISESPYEFEIEIKYSDYEGHHTVNPPSVVIYCKYTDKYPEELPIIDIPRYNNLPDDYVLRLKELIDEEAEKSIGTVMVYSLITLTQNFINEYEDNIKKEVALEKEKKAQIEADLERKKFEGERVTKESFLKWRTAFDLERNPLKICPAIVEKKKKLTGRELFIKDVSLNESDLKFLEEDGELVKVDESLFQNLNNLTVE